MKTIQLNENNYKNLLQLGTKFYSASVHYSNNDIFEITKFPVKFNGSFDSGGLINIADHGAEREDRVSKGAWSPVIYDGNGHWGQIVLK